MLSKKRFPKAKIFSLTASPAVLKVNYYLGYKEKPFDYFRTDKLFLEGNESEVDYLRLMDKGYNNEGEYVAMILE